MTDKFEREINEILSKIEDFPKHAAHRRRLSARVGRRVGSVQRAFALRMTRVSVSQIMLTAIGVIVASYFLRSLWGGLWVYGLILGLILFFTAFALSFRGGGAPGRSEPYFRGRPRSYYESSQPTVSDRIREWWRKQRRDRR